MGPPSPQSTPVWVARRTCASMPCERNARLHLCAALPGGPAVYLRWKWHGPSQQRCCVELVCRVCTFEAAWSWSPLAECIQAVCICQHVKALFHSERTHVAGQVCAASRYIHEAWPGLRGLD